MSYQSSYQPSVMRYILEITAGTDFPVETAERLENKSREVNIAPEALISKFITEGLGQMDLKEHNVDQIEDTKQ